MKKVVEKSYRFTWDEFLDKLGLNGDHVLALEDVQVHSLLSHTDPEKPLDVHVILLESVEES